MLKKSLLTSLGAAIFMVGMILFPLPVPLGLPTMIIGLSILLKASPQGKRRLLGWIKQNRRLHPIWRKGREFQRRHLRF